jgi:hypothetical protein
LGSTYGRWFIAGFYCWLLLLAFIAGFYCWVFQLVASDLSNRVFSTSVSDGVI